jgi:polynucleotide 5'-kinase involved in rRNA processing
MMVQEQTPIIIKNYPLTFKFSNNTKERTNFLEEVIEFCKKEQPTFIEDCLSVAEKIIIVGDHNVGKTCLVRRYCENTFTDGYKVNILFFINIYIYLFSKIKIKKNKVNYWG